MTLRIEVDPERPNHKLLKKAADMLAEEQAVAILPTDTSYAFACAITDKKSMERVYRLSEINPKTPRTFLCPKLEVLQNYTQAISNPVYRVLKHAVPGKNTFIFNASKLTPKRLVTARKEIGIRIPDAKIPAMILQDSETMILISSVPHAEDETHHYPEEIFDRYGKQVDVFIDAGEMPISESSVIRFTEDTPEIIRKGDSDLSVFAPLL